MKRAITALSLLVFIVILAGCGNDRSFTIDQVDIQAYILEDGDLYVEELYTYTFQGEYNGTTRRIGSKGHEGVEFFEAYLPPAGAQIGEFTYEDSMPLRTEFHEDTFRIYTQSSDETKQVFYRYRLRHAVHKFLDTAEWYWSFFDEDNETDLHQLSIEIVLPRAVDTGKVNYYLHDRTEGQIYSVFGQSLHYYTELMPSFQKTEFRILFPNDWLPDSPLTAEEYRKASIQAEEERLGQRFEQREERLIQAEKTIHQASFLILLAMAYFTFFAPYQFRGRFGKRISWQELETLDPLFVAYMYRKGKFIQKDITAGLFSLYQKGMVQISKVPTSERFRKDPKAPAETLEFSFIGDKDQLKEDELYFVHWLFKAHANQNPSFTLESISGPSKAERNNQKRMNAYRKRKERFDAKFKSWSQKVLEQAPFANDYTENRAIRIVVLLLTLFTYAMTIYLYYIDVTRWSSLLWATVILGIFAGVAIWKWRSLLAFYTYCVLCFITFSQITFTDASFYLTGTLILAFIIRALLPARVPTVAGAPYRKAIVKWRKALKRASYPVGNELARLERLMQYALILEISKPFVNQHTTFERYKELEEAFPLVAVPQDTSNYFQYTYHSWNHWGSADQSSSGSGSSYGGGGGGGYSGSGGGGGAGAF